MRRRLLALLGVTGLLLLVAMPAFAHVAVDGTDTAMGAEATTLTFRVPNEQDHASTTQLDVFLPTNVKFELVAAQPIAGWTTVVDKSEVTWSGGKIGPGEFQEFKIEAGPLPDDVDSLVFKAIQTYDNGDIVRWIDPTPASGAEPDHPAPVLTLAAASGDHGAAAESGDKAATKKSVDQAKALAVTGMVMALVAGFVAVRAQRAGRPNT